MIHYRKILELHDEGISFRGIAASTGNSCQKVTVAIGLAEKKGLVCPLEEEMTNQWIEEFLFPEKTLESSGRQPLKFDYIHEELAKPNVTLSLLHHEYEADCRANNKIPYSYRSFLRHYSKYADKYKATLRIRRKPCLWNNSLTSSFLNLYRSLIHCTIPSLQLHILQQIIHQQIQYFFSMSYLAYVITS